MNNKILKIGLVVLVIGALGFAASQTFSESNGQSQDNQIAATVHMSPDCGCCSVFSSYLKQENYAVTMEHVNSMEAVKQELGVPAELYSCHTTEVEGYVVEGHVPEAAIAKLIEEKPDIKGIGMKGMPAGSPGMPGPKTDDFVIYEITESGERGDVFMRI